MSKPRKQSKQRVALLDTVSSVHPADALRELDDGVTTGGTKATYAPSVVKYEEVVRAAAAHQGFESLKPWPASTESIRVFVAYLKRSKAYANPATDLFAVLAEVRKRGQRDVADDVQVSELLKSLERGAEPQEQAGIIALRELRKMANAVSTEIDFETWLSCACAFFCLARIDSFLSLTVDDVKFADGKLRVRLSNLKGEVRKTILEPEFERISTEVPFDFPNFDKSSVPCCPVGCFRVLQARAMDAGRSSLSFCVNKQYQKFLRCFNVLIRKTDLAGADVNRRRAEFSPHSTRIGAVCTLLRAGLAEKVISALANWTSEQISRYSREVMLHPDCVTAFRFYNPRNLAGSYGSGIGGDSCGTQGSKRRKISTQ